MDKIYVIAKEVDETNKIGDFQVYRMISKEPYWEIIPGVEGKRVDCTEDPHQIWIVQ